MAYYGKKIFQISTEGLKQIPSDLLLDWLAQSKNKKNNAFNTIVDKYKAKTIYTMCQKMTINRGIYFLSLEIMKRIIEIKKIRQDCKDLILHPTMAMLIAILLAHKISGKKQDYFLLRLLSLAHEFGCYNFDSQSIIKLEYQILTWLKFDLPHTTSLDDLNTLIMAVLQPMITSESIIVSILKQSIDTFTYVHIYLEEFSKVLKDSYSADESKKTTYKLLSQQNLFLPVGVILHTLFVNKSQLQCTYVTACNAIVQCTSNSKHDFKTFIKVTDVYVKNVFCK